MFSFLFRVLVAISYILLVSMFFWVIDKMKYLPITMGKKRNDLTPETAYNVGGESSSTSNTLNSTPGRKYDVFLSFAGKDTRFKFTDHLYHALSKAGIKAFRDDEGIERGEVISQQLIEAIEDSVCAVVVLSENYANSPWCLDELQMILECKRKLGQKVFPIFYDIEPSDVRHQRKSFGKASAEHKKRFRVSKDKVQNWRNALSEIGHLSGLVNTGRDTLQKEGLVSVQKRLLSYPKIEGMEISDEYEGKEMIIRHLSELGRDIVHQESPNDVCKRSRLWKFGDIKQVLENDKGSEAIQAIVMQDNYQNQGRIELHPEAFSKMSSIRLLLFRDTMAGSLLIPRGFKFPDTLKFVRWPSFPFEVVRLKTQLWNVTQMKFIDLSNAQYFIETPDFSGVPCLEHLCLRWCMSLVKVHPSLGELKKLVEVDLYGCVNLEILPRELKTNSLVKLDLGGCGKVLVLPEFGKGMEKLSYLDVSYTAITRVPEALGSLIGLTDLNLSWCGLNDGSIPDDFGCLSSLILLDLSRNGFVNLPTACFSSLFRLLFLSLDGCKKLKSLPRLPPRLIRLNASGCDSMKPFLSSDGQLWNLIASLDHEYRRQTEYVISDDEEYDDMDTPSKFKDIELKHLPLRDFFANVPGCKIPSWFPNKSNESRFRNCEHVIEVKIPPYLRDSQWSGIVVCLHISHDFSGLITWSSKAPGDDDYIWKEWAHRSTIWRGQNHRLCIMVLELNEKTCWRHLKAGENSLHVKLYAQNSSFFNLIASGLGPIPVSNLECGWRVICKERIQKWCNDNDFNQLTQSQLASPHDEINFPSRVFNKLISEAYKKQRTVKNR